MYVCLRVYACVFSPASSTAMFAARKTHNEASMLPSPCRQGPPIGTCTHLQLERTVHSLQKTRRTADAADSVCVVVVVVPFDFAALVSAGAAVAVVAVVDAVAGTLLPPAPQT